MFRIAEVYVDDKKLSAFLKAVAGLVHNMDFPQPVVNAEPAANGKIRQATEGKIEDLFMTHLRQRRLAEFDNDIVREFLTGIGKSPMSANYVTKSLKKRGFLRAGKKRGFYSVTAKR